MSAGHVAVCGMTDSGKSHCAKYLARRARQDGRAVLVLDPFLAKDWSHSWITADPDEFMWKAKRSSGCMLVVDECGITIGTGTKARGKEWLVTASRHLGHRCMLVMQRAIQVEPIFRDNVSELYLFAVKSGSAEIWAEAFNDDALLFASRLPKRDFLFKRLFERVIRYSKLPPLK